VEKEIDPYVEEWEANAYWPVGEAPDPSKQVNAADLVKKAAEWSGFSATIHLVQSVQIERVIAMQGFNASDDGVSLAGCLHKCADCHTNLNPHQPKPTTTAVDLSRVFLT
jgi:hypothetical protein